MSSLQQHAQKVVMERTPYKNRLFVIYAVKAAFEKDPTVPRTIVDAVQHAVEDYTRIKTRALQPSPASGPDAEVSIMSEPAPPVPPTGGGLISQPPAALAAGADSDETWKQRLAEAIDLVMAHSGNASGAADLHASVDADSLGGGGDDSSPAASPAASPAPVARRKRFTESEVRNLQAGVQIHGEGKWTQILQDTRLQFDDIRTPVSLKDKWRHLSKKNSRQR